MMNKKLLIFAAVVLSLFAILIGFFLGGLGKNPQELPSVLTGRPLPEISSPDFFDPQKTITAADLPQNQPFLLNIWGSWCPACLQEHPYLLKLKDKIPIVGVNWAADNPTEAQDGKQLLEKLGNPYRLVLSDPNGNLITNLGVYGAPETFLISAKGEILFRYAGPLDENIWLTDFVPRLEKLQKK